MGTFCQFGPHIFWNMTDDFLSSEVGTLDFDGRAARATPAPSLDEIKIWRKHKVGRVIRARRSDAARRVNVQPRSRRARDCPPYLASWFKNAPDSYNQILAQLRQVGRVTPCAPFGRGRACENPTTFAAGKGLPALPGVFCFSQIIYDFNV